MISPEEKSVERIEAIMKATDLKFDQVPDAFFPVWVRERTEKNAQSLVAEENHVKLEDGDLYVLRKQG